MLVGRARVVVLLYMSLTRNYNMHTYMKRNDQLAKYDKTYIVVAK
jgi:hypothetical protein